MFCVSIKTATRCEGRCNIKKYRVSRIQYRVGDNGFTYKGLKG